MLALTITSRMDQVLATVSVAYFGISALFAGLTQAEGARQQLPLSKRVLGVGLSVLWPILVIAAVLAAASAHAHVRAAHQRRPVRYEP